MEVFFGLLGSLFFTAGLVMLLFSVIKKSPKKKAWIVTGIGLAITTFVITLSPAPDENKIKQESLVAAEQSKEKAALVKKEKEEKLIAKEKAAAEKKLADEKVAAEKKAEEEKQAEDKRIAEEQARVEKEKAEKAKAAGTASSANAVGLVPVKLVKTIDGDTIKIMYEGKEQNVRYLLIDTPETSHPRLGKQPFGPEAKERNRALVNSGNLEIEFDIGQSTDKYGRLLAYVYVDGKSVNETLIEEGLARVAYVYPPNTRHLDPFEKAQARAKEKGIGIWSVENYATDSGFNGGKSSSASSNAGGSSNSASNGGSSNATPPPAAAPAPAPATGGTEFFQNCTELRKVYPNGVPKGHPAYASKHDRDKDDFACER